MLAVMWSLYSRITKSIIVFCSRTAICKAVNYSSLNVGLEIPLGYSFSNYEASENEFNFEMLEQEWKQYLDGDNDSSFHIWQLLSVALSLKENA